jgi:hypothetical protein
VGTDLDLPSVGITDANIHHHSDLDVNGVYDAIYASEISEEVPMYFIASLSVKDPRGGHAPPDRHTVEIVTFADYGKFEKWARGRPARRGAEYDGFKNEMGL